MGCAIVKYFHCSYERILKTHKINEKYCKIGIISRELKKIYIHKYIIYSVTYEVSASPFFLSSALLLFRSFLRPWNLDLFWSAPERRNAPFQRCRAK